MQLFPSAPVLLDLLCNVELLQPVGPEVFVPYLHQMAKVCAVSFGLNSFDGENNELIPASHVLCRIQAVSSMKGELANPLAG